jgi:hypothetical protein
LVEYVLHEFNASSDYRRAKRERVRVIKQNSLPRERRLARDGIRKANHLYGNEAWQSFRRSHALGDAVRAFAWSPGHILAAVGNKAVGRR